MPCFEDITVDDEPGTTREVTMPDGSRIFLRKLDADYDPTDPKQAWGITHETRDEQKLITGLLYVNPKTHLLTDELNLVDAPL